MVRDQQAGAVVSTIEAPRLGRPAVTQTGLLVFGDAYDGGPALRASTLSGQPRWQHRLEKWSIHPPLVRSDHLVVADGATLRAFDFDGDPLWTATRHEFRSGDAVFEPGEIVGPLVGLPNGDILAAIRAGNMNGCLIVDPEQGSVRSPAHLPSHGLYLPLGDLLVMQGWPEKDDLGRFQPVVIGFNPTSGETVFRYRVPVAPDSMAAGSNGLAAVAGSPTSDRWDKYHGWPGYDLTHHCYVHFLDQSGLRGEWRPEKPITGPLAVGVDGDLLVFVSGELCSIV